MNQMANDIIQNPNATISIITVVLNRAGHIKNAINSVNNQTYSQIEHVIIDGGSTDGTIEVIETTIPNGSTKRIFVSELDRGVYDAINKGVLLCTSEVVGLLHSDDVFAHPQCIESVMTAFQEDPAIEVVYGDIVIYNEEMTRSVRYWKAGTFKSTKLKWGWMPPHPAIFLRKSVFDRFGLYDISYRVSADYDFIIRILNDGTLKTSYIPEVLVYMRTGGISGNNYPSIMKEDYRAIKTNRIGGVATLACKYLRSASQLFIKYKLYA